MDQNIRIKPLKLIRFIKIFVIHSQTLVRAAKPAGHKITAVVAKQFYDAVDAEDELFPWYL